MSKFIYVFCKEGVRDLTKRGYNLLKEDEKNSIWVFENKNPDDIEFEVNYQVVLSDVLSF